MDPATIEAGALFNTQECLAGVAAFVAFSISVVAVTCTVGQTGFAVILPSIVIGTKDSGRIFVSWLSIGFLVRVISFGVKLDSTKMDSYP